MKLRFSHKKDDSGRIAVRSEFDGSEWIELKDAFYRTETLIKRNSIDAIEVKERKEGWAKVLIYWASNDSTLISEGWLLEALID